MWSQFGGSIFALLLLLLASLTVASENRLRFQRQSGLTLAKWPSNTVNYYFDGLSSSQEAIATRVMLDAIEAATCLNFVESSSATDRIRIHSDPTAKWCESSDYGYAGGEQEISFGSKCLYDGLFAKALLHALGFYRMEVRSDRDDWVTFSTNDVDPALRDGLAKLDASTSGNPLIYNFGSVVHSSYDMYAYNETTGYPMMAQLDQYYLSMGAGIITSYDLDMINLYYDCYSGCTNTSSMCQMEGNLNTRTCSECSCPLGFGGAVCETNADGGQTLTATDEWQDLVLSVTGPATLDTPGAYAFDSAVIVTPSGYNFIQFRPTNFTAECPYCTPGCRDFGLEIKYRNHPQRTSPRVCCNEFTGSTFSSRNDRTSIVLYSSTIDVSATIQYRASATNTTVLPTLPPYEVQTCQSETCNLFPLPDEVCAVLMIDQSIVLPILDYLSDPIALVQILLTHGNCSDDSSGIEHGMTYTVGCPIVSGVAGFFSGFVDMIGATDYIDQAGFYVTVFQIAFDAVHQSVHAGVEAVTSEMCPDWVAEDVTTTASP